MDLRWPLEWAGLGHRLWWSPQLELWALMVQECQAEVVAEVINVDESDEGWQYASLTEHVWRPSAGIKQCVKWSMSGMYVPWHETLWQKW